MIRVHCIGCSASFNVPEGAAGKRAKCPKCQTVNPVALSAPDHGPAPNPETALHAAAPAARAPVSMRAIAAAAPADSVRTGETPASSVGVAVGRFSAHRRLVRRSNSLPAILIGGGGAAVFVVIASAFVWHLSGSKDDDAAPKRPKNVPPRIASPETNTPRESVNPPKLEPIGDQVAQVGEGLDVHVLIESANERTADVRYSLGAGAPLGAAIDPGSGRFTWTPNALDGGKVFAITVTATREGSAGATASQSFQVTVEAAPVVPWRELIAFLEERGAVVRPLGESPSAPFSGTCHLLEVDTHRVVVFEYDSIETLQRDVNQIPADAKTVFGAAQTWEGPVHFFHDDRLIAQIVGGDPQTLNLLDARFGRPFATANVDSLATAYNPSSVEGPGSPAVPQEPDAVTGVLLDLFERRKLFNVREYPTIRHAFAERFEREHATELTQAFGSDFDETMKWLNEHIDVKEELFLAIDPRYDNIPAALGIFKSLKDQFPDKIVPYANLAIAVAVAWDDPPRGIYLFDHHARRTHSTVPVGLVDAVGNFTYFLNTEAVMQGRGQFLPWEFLVHVVNHKTPENERQWALSNYLQTRAMYGKCYHDVPYDYEMLRSGDATCRLGGKEYSLPNIRQFGGVCAMQADFASRVGKSMCVPAELVWGQSNSGESHAWVMWIELKAVSKTSIAFTLESHGRYRGDKYYVGNLIEPHSGQRITDRDLELRLNIVGRNAIAKRQADLIMQAYPALRERLSLEIDGQLDFLEQVIKLSPGNESAWIAVSQISKNPSFEKKHQKQMMQVLDGLFVTFAAFPDFTWKIFGDLVAFQDNAKKRNELYNRLVVLYEQAGRPDLACEARLKLTEYLLVEEQSNEAIQGLAFTVRKFPDEGRYVPRMLDKLEEICKAIPGTEQQLVEFYVSFLPTVPKKRGEEPSKYCMQMYERGVARFQEFGQPQLAQVYQAELAKLKASATR